MRSVVMQLYRHLPSVDDLKRAARWSTVDVPEHLKTTVCREVVDAVRALISSKELQTAHGIADAVDAELTRRLACLEAPSLKPVLNGLGVLIHTNAGRAPLSREALDLMVSTARGYSNLELELSSGERGSRQDHLRPLVRWLFEADDGLVVNNGAGALMLALHALAVNQRVIVSRGELVEIGGSFRVPDVMLAAGVELVEVGTTNRTWPSDFERADGALILQVHRSNFRQEGFVHSVDVPALAAIARDRGLPLVVDLGSGVVEDLRRWGLAPEPTVAETLAAGADLVTFSGDKLLGGPQAGFLVGRADLVHRARRCAMARALRVDGLILAGIESTLRAHLAGQASHQLPLWQAIDLPLATLKEWAQLWASTLRGALGHPWQVDVIESQCAIGGGAQPGTTVASVALEVGSPQVSAAKLAQSLRAASPALLARPRGDQVWIDLLSLWAGAREGSEQALTDAFASAQALIASQRA